MGSVPSKLVCSRSISTRRVDSRDRTFGLRIGAATSGDIGPYGNTTVDNVIHPSTSMNRKPATKTRFPVGDGQAQASEGSPNETSIDDPGKPSASTPGAKTGPSASTVAPCSDHAPAVLRILEIFPDADVSYVKTKLEEANHDISDVVVELSEDDNYPRQTKRAARANLHGNGGTLIRRTKASAPEPEPEPKHDYSSPTIDFRISRAYEKEVIDLLSYDFSFLKKRAINRLLRTHGYRYTLTRNRIHEMIVGDVSNRPAAPAAAAGSGASRNAEETETKNYHLLRGVVARGVLPMDVRMRLGKRYCLVRCRKKIGLPCPVIRDRVLNDEHFHFEKKFNRWLNGVKARLRKEEANKLALENGTSVECCCCFGDVSVSLCVPCKEEGVSFCTCSIWFGPTVRTTNLLICHRVAFVLPRLYRPVRGKPGFWVGESRN